jgi:hypothetical protein
MHCIIYHLSQLRYNGKWLKLFKIFLRAFYSNYQVHRDFDYRVLSAAETYGSNNSIVRESS